MASSPRSEREEERRHNIRTLVIASVASATAAAVTSQLWIAGTWIAAAVTPVLVALVSEILNRPADRLARAWTSERPALPEDAEEPRPARPTPQPRTTPPSAPGETPVRIYRQPSTRPPRRRKLAVGAILATGLLAFAIAAVTLTAGELLAGGSIGKGDKRTTFFRGAKTEQQDKKQPADERQTDTTERQPAETTRETPSEQPTETETTPPETTTETTPVPTPRSAPAAPEAAPPTETAPVP